MDMQQQTIEAGDMKVLVWTVGVETVIKIECEHYGSGAVLSARELDDLLAVLSVARGCIKP